MGPRYPSRLPRHSQSSSDFHVGKGGKEIRLDDTVETPRTPSPEESLSDTKTLYTNCMKDINTFCNNNCYIRKILNCKKCPLNKHKTEVRTG